MTVDHQFSAKPQPGGSYDDFYHQVSTYCMILGGPASEIDPTATARCFAPVVPDAEEDSSFHYLDTASSRAEITQLPAWLCRRSGSVKRGRMVSMIR